ncbi:hypothetical protein BY996DRAFT_6585475 [Phakopsora pachyrhizi]|nr:hypothetical protein BY996DRAFT_6585475 [Phakopsora pachyrhizi]
MEIQNRLPDISERTNVALIGTLFGVVFGMMQEVEDQKTPLQLLMDKLSKKLSTIFIAEEELARDVCGWKNLVSLAVAAIFKGLPILVTVTLALGPRTEHEELMRLIEKIDNLPKNGDCGYTCVAWSSGKGREISTPELIRKYLSAELKKDKKMYGMFEGRNIDEDIRNTQAWKSAGVAGWLKMPLFGYAIANHLRRPLYYFSLDSMHTYLPTSSSYSGYPPFCIAFENSNHYVVLHFKKVNWSIPAPPIDGWWLRKSSSTNKNLWLQSLENDLKLFQNLMPSSSGGAVINLD